MKRILLALLILCALPFLQRSTASPYLRGAGAFVWYSCDFAGTDDYMSRATPVGLSDGKAWAVSFWVKVEGAEGVNRTCLVGNANGFRCRIQSNDLMRCASVTPASGDHVKLHSGADLFQGTPGNDGWVHVCASTDGAGGSNWAMMVDGVSQTTGNPVNNNDDTADLAGATDWFIGVESTLAADLDGKLSEMLFWDEWIDFSQAATLAKVYAGDKPVFPGHQGELVSPSGTPAKIYMRFHPQRLAQNSGTGGDFSITGTVTAGGSDRP